MSPIGTPLNEVAINSALNSAYWRVKVVEETGSTQIDLSSEVRNGRASSGDVIVAEYQRNGRGRLDRSFVAPRGSALLFSFFISPQQKTGLGGHWGWLPLLASQGVLTTIRTFVKDGDEISLSLKWPNDVLCNEKKVAGVLCERINLHDNPGLIVGIGINVSTTREELPHEDATSLALEGLSKVDRNDLLVKILRTLTGLLRRWESNDPSLIQEYCDLSATIGRKVRVEAPVGVTREAVAVGIEPSGSLMLDDATVISVGDIVHIRRE